MAKKLVFTFGDRRFAYAPCSEDEVPSDVRFDVPRQFQNQGTEYAFAQPGARAECGIGDLFLRVSSHEAPTRFYKLAE